MLFGDLVGGSCSKAEKIHLSNLLTEVFQSYSNLNGNISIGMLLAIKEFFACCPFALFCTLLRNNSSRKPSGKTFIVYAVKLLYQFISIGQTLKSFSDKKTERKHPHQCKTYGKYKNMFMELVYLFKLDNNWHKRYTRNWKQWVLTTDAGTGGWA